jgi:hypothetical protein
VQSKSYHQVAFLTIKDEKGEKEGEGGEILPITNYPITNTLRPNSPFSIPYLLKDSF